jgi:AcrR family transcriptional regulator
MLMEALVRLLDRKEFDDISVQEIADEATLNRATFYLHYADKNALLQAMTAARFRDLIARRGLSFTDCDGALRAIALGVCDYLAETMGCPSQLTKMPLEGSIIPVVEGMFLAGAAHHPRSPVSISSCLEPRPPGRYSGRAAGCKRQIAFPPRRWLRRLRRW